jgi:predicted outer membrane protein
MKSLQPGGAAILFGVALSSVACGPAPEIANNPAPPLATPAPAMAGIASAQASSTESFVARVAASRRIEIEASRVALRRAAHPLVRQFARSAEREAQAALREFRGLAAAADAPAPGALDGDAGAAIAAVRASNARSVDAHYLDVVIRARETAIDELERYREGGANDALRAFCADQLRTLRTRLQEADTLRQSVNLGAGAGKKR